MERKIGVYYCDVSGTGKIRANQRMSSVNSYLKENLPGLDWLVVPSRTGNGDDVKVLSEVSMTELKRILETEEALNLELVEHIKSENNEKA